MNFENRFREQLVINHSLYENNERLLKSIEKMSVNVENAQKELQKVNEQCIVLKTKYDNLHKDYVNVKNKVKIMRNEDCENKFIEDINNLKKEINTMQQINSSLTRHNNFLENNNNQLKNNNEKLKETNDKLKSKNKSLNNDNKSLKDEIKKLQEELERNQEEMNNEESDNESENDIESDNESENESDIESNNEECDNEESNNNEDKINSEEIIIENNEHKSIIDKQSKYLMCSIGFLMIIILLAYPIKAMFKGLI